MIKLKNILIWLVGIILCLPALIMTSCNRGGTGYNGNVCGVSTGAVGDLAVTLKPDTVTPTFARIRGKISAPNDVKEIREIGFVVASDGAMTLTAGTFTAGIREGNEFYADIKDLKPGWNYYYRAYLYARTKHGRLRTYYGDELGFGTPVVIDE